jgi:hypothetical protein
MDQRTGKTSAHHRGHERISSDAPAQAEEASPGSQYYKQLTGRCTSVAGDNVNLLGRAELSLADIYLVQEDVARVLQNSAQGGIRDGARLLMRFP